VIVGAFVLGVIGVVLVRVGWAAGAAQDFDAAACLKTGPQYKAMVTSTSRQDPHRIFLKAFGLIQI
jgi:hypothetical protein